MYFIIVKYSGPAVLYTLKILNDVIYTLQYIYIHYTRLRMLIGLHNVTVFDTRVAMYLITYFFFVHFNCCYVSPKFGYTYIYKFIEIMFILLQFWEFLFSFYFLYIVHSR